MPKRLKNNEIIAALRKTDGNRTDAAKFLGVDSSYLYERIDKTPELQRIMIELEYSLIDLGESAMRQMVSDGNFRATKYVLDNKGASRGWGRGVAPYELNADEKDVLPEVSSKLNDSQKDQIIKLLLEQ